MLDVLPALLDVLPALLAGLLVQLAAGGAAAAALAPAPALLLAVELPGCEAWRRPLARASSAAAQNSTCGTTHAAHC